jgi:hypothetical protein
MTSTLTSTQLLTIVLNALFPLRNQVGGSSATDVLQQAQAQGVAGITLEIIQAGLELGAKRGMWFLLGNIQTGVKYRFNRDMIAYNYQNKEFANSGVIFQPSVIFATSNGPAFVSSHAKGAPVGANLPCCPEVPIFPYTWA